jgi:hypothetical protein
MVLMATTVTAAPSTCRLTSRVAWKCKSKGASESRELRLMLQQDIIPAFVSKEEKAKQ